MQEKYPVCYNLLKRPMFFQRLFVMLLICVSSFSVKAQFTDRYWTFGEHAAINFSNLSNPVPDTSKLNTLGTSASICDSLGNLLFYAASPDDSLLYLPNNFQNGYVLNKMHSRMENCDSLKASEWHQQMIIVPDPGNPNRFYLFHTGVAFTTNPGLFYSVIDLNYNGGLGKVILKNMQLHSVTMGDALTVIRHGNGRDWWLIAREVDQTVFSNNWYIYLVSPSGITSLPVQNIGTLISNGILKFKPNQDGTRLYAVQFDNLIERFDFDRCTGLLSNTLTITPFDAGPYGDNRWSVAVSPDESKLYTTSIYNGSFSDSSFLMQYDLNATNIAASVDTLYTFNRSSSIALPVAGMLQVGPDGKIYLGSYSDATDCGWFWIYCDTTSFFTENMNLSVINYPDSLGAACDFQPYSFYLGGHRSYMGLPNNPNYELGKWVGSPCDTLGTVGVNEFAQPKPQLFVYYDTDWQKAFINAKALYGKYYKLSVYEISGKLITREQGELQGEFFSYGLSMSGLSNGVYLISLETEKEKLLQRMVK